MLFVLQQVLEKTHSLQEKKFDDANVNGKGDRLISTPNSKVKVYVIPTNEELVIARDTKRLLNL